MTSFLYITGMGPTMIFTLLQAFYTLLPLPTLVESEGLEGRRERLRE